MGTLCAEQGLACKCNLQTRRSPTMATLCAEPLDYIRESLESDFHWDSIVICDRRSLRRFMFYASLRDGASVPD